MRMFCNGTSIDERFPHALRECLDERQYILLFLPLNQYPIRTTIGFLIPDFILKHSGIILLVIFPWLRILSQMFNSPDEFIVLIIPDWAPVILDVPEWERGFVACAVDYGVDIVEICITFKDDAA